MRADRDGGGSRGRMEDANSVSDFAWNPADHATYCPQHNEPPPDGGGSSWLCCCSGPLFELRAAARAVIDAEYGSNSWAEAFDVLVDVVLEQERLEALAEREELTAGEQAPASPTPSRSASALSDFARFYDAVDKAQKIDNTGGDSAVSVALWSWAELRARERLAAEDRAGEVAFRGEEGTIRLTRGEAKQIEAALRHDHRLSRLAASLRARLVAAEDRAATVRLYGEEHVAELEREANR